MKPAPLLLILALAALASLVWTASRPASAGGWSVVTLDASPENVAAGEDTVIGFRVLQHGRTPMPGLKAAVHAVHRQSGQSVKFTASDDGQPGHYAVTVNLPQPGAWDWWIDAYEGKHPMYPIMALPPPDLASAGLVAGAPGGELRPLSQWQWAVAVTGGAAALAMAAGLGAAFALRPRALSQKG